MAVLREFHEAKVDALLETLARNASDVRQRGLIRAAQVALKTDDSKKDFHANGRVSEL
jgi:hypothetical protein